ncbi:hypothetical protein [Nocardioides sp. W7]|uniref:hypothetical protein n=1 Tax=Nocardioides sp. W7 TaxID=2931390 RepID=UPI001FD00F7C|nr:hypothetical protein [Nocardioides sp. W7]
MDLLVVTGVDPALVDRAMMSLSWDSPRAVAVRHRIDPESQQLTRVVSHAGGILEHEGIALEHACISCALRKDVVPTLERLARDGQWATAVVALPTSTEAVQLDTVLASDLRLARRLRRRTTVAVLGAEHLGADLLSAVPLRDRRWHTGPDDERGTGETLNAPDRVRRRRRPRPGPEP